MLYKRISNDTRHTGLSLIWCSGVEKRVFSNWAMGYAGPAEIGRHTKETFHSLAELKDEERLTEDNSYVALGLAKTMFAEFQRRG